MQDCFPYEREPGTDKHNLRDGADAAEASDYSQANTHTWKLTWNT